MKIIYGLFGIVLLAARLDAQTVPYTAHISWSPSTLTATQLATGGPITGYKLYVDSLPASSTIPIDLTCPKIPPETTQRCQAEYVVTKPGAHRYCVSAVQAGSILPESYQTCATFPQAPPGVMNVEVKQKP